MPPDSASIPWTRVGLAPPGALADARRQAHWAVQAVAAVGNTLLDPREDFSHTALTHQSGLLWSEYVDGFRVGLRIVDLTVVVASSDGTTPDGFSVVGKTLEEVTREIRLHATRRSGRGVRGLTRPAHDMPPDSVATGSTFEGAPSVGLEELAAWYDNASLVLSPVAGRADASPIRCWPHHFDLATLITRSKDPLRTVGVGMSPGDGSYPDPYFYVTPWPYPDRDPAAPLPSGGHWHTGGWTGAVLTTDAIRAHRRPEDQRAVTETFIRAALEAAVSLP